jgi:hypothetical protein
VHGFLPSQAQAAAQQAVAFLSESSSLKNPHPIPLDPPTSLLAFSLRLRYFTN